MPKSFHATSADARLDEFYRPDVASLVTVVFREDLARFGYPAWDARVAADAYLARIRGLRPAPGQTAEGTRHSRPKVA